MTNRYRSPEPTRFGRPQTQSPRALAEIAMRAGQQRAIMEGGQQILGTEQPTPFVKPEDRPENQPRIEPDRGFFAKAGMGALKGLVAGQETGGGLLRLGLQKLTPGEQGVETAFKNQKEGNFFQRVRKASVSTEGFEIETPFDNVHITIGGKDIKLLPSRITGRGVAEVIGDPLNVVALVPFVGAPIRAAEMAAFGAIKGAVGGVATGVARTAAQKSVGGVIKSAGVGLPVNTVASVAEETLKGAAKSFDFEKRIIGRYGKAGVTPTATAPAVDAKIPDIEFGAGTTQATKKAEIDAFENSVDNTISGITKPFERFRNSRTGKWVAGNETRTFRQLFGTSKVGRAFTERVNGLRGIVRAGGNDAFAKVSKALHLHNIAQARGLQQNGFKARFMELAEKAMDKATGKQTLIYDDDGYLQNALYQAGELATTIAPNIRNRTHSLSILENIFYDPIEKRVVTGKSNLDVLAPNPKKQGEFRLQKQEVNTVRNQDGSVEIQYKDGNNIRLTNDQVNILEDTLTYLNDAGLHAFKKEIQIIKGIYKGTPNKKKNKDLQERALLIRKDIARRINLAERKKLGTGKAKRDVLDIYGLSQKRIVNEQTITDGDILNYIGQNPELLVKTFGGTPMFKKHNSSFFLDLTKGGGVEPGVNYVTRVLKDVASANEEMSDAMSILGHSTRRSVTGGKTRLEIGRDYTLDQLLDTAKTSGTLIYRPSEIIEAYSKGAIKKSIRDELNDELSKIAIKELSTNNKKLQQDIVKIMYPEGKKGIKKGTPGPTFTEAQAILFKQETNTKDIGNLLIRQLGIGKEKSSNAAFFKWINEEIFAPMRGFRAGLDLGFMGINTLPVLFINPVAYGKTWGNIIKTFGQKDKYLNFLQNKSNVIEEMTESGIHMSSYGADLYDSLQRPGSSIGLLSRTPGVGNTLEKVASKTLSPFEQSFYAAVDSARISLFEFYSPLWNNLDDAALQLATRRQMADFINYSTGGYSTVEAGLTPTQRDIESSWVFFSPRYTRASMGLVSLVFDGSVQGAEARRLLANALTAGTMMYASTCEALGVEPNFDPTSSEFFSVPIGGDLVGPGTFYRQLVTLNARMIENPEALYFSDDKPGVQFEEKLFNHPIVRFFRGRTPIGTGYAIDLATGSDYLGRELDGWQDNIEHAATLGVPFWAESLLFADPYRAGPAGFVSEMLGARSFPRNPYQRRRELRDALAAKEYGHEFEWNTLNQAEKNNIQFASVELQNLDEEVKKVKGDRAGGFDIRMEEYLGKRDVIKDTFRNTIIEKSEAVNLSNTSDTLDELYSVTYPQAMAAKRRAEIKLKEEYADIINYFDEKLQSGEYVKQYPDMVYDEYREQVNDPTIRADGTIDGARRRRLQQVFFDTHPGFEDYATQYWDTFNNDPDSIPVIQERNTFLDKWGDRYFEGVQNHVFNESPRLQPYETSYNYFRELTQEQRDYVRSAKQPVVAVKMPPVKEGDPAVIREFNVLAIKEISNRINKYQKAMRQQNIELDTGIYRYGIEGSRTVYHPENKAKLDSERRLAGPFGIEKQSSFKLLNYESS